MDYMKYLVFFQRFRLRHYLIINKFKKMCTADKALCVLHVYCSLPIQLIVSAVISCRIQICLILKCFFILLLHNNT